jgi:hypothetical protein
MRCLQLVISLVTRANVDIIASNKNHLQKFYFYDCMVSATPGYCSRCSPRSDVHAAHVAVVSLPVFYSEEPLLIPSWFDKWPFSGPRLSLAFVDANR